jgi:hypothetical protein
MVGYSSLFVFVLGLVTKNIEQLCEERNRSSHFLPFFRDQKPETTDWERAFQDQRGSSGIQVGDPLAILLISMRTRRIRNFYIFRKDSHAPRVSASPYPTLYPTPPLIFFLFVPAKKELPLAELERLGICAARRAREEVKKKMMGETGSK